MNRTWLCLFAATVVLSEGSKGLAQPIPPAGPVQRPTISPYLNLLNRGGSPALNYLGIVRPQQQLAQQFGQLQLQANLTSQMVNQAYSQEAGASNDMLAPTGTVAVFNNTGSYFNRIGGVGAGSFGGLSAGGFGAAGGFQRPSFAGGRVAGGMARPPAGGLRR